MFYALKAIRPLRYWVWLHPRDNKGPVAWWMPNTQQSSGIPIAVSLEHILASLLCNRGLVFPKMNDLK